MQAVMMYQLTELKQKAGNAIKRRMRMGEMNEENRDGIKEAIAAGYAEHFLQVWGANSILCLVPEDWEAATEDSRIDKVGFTFLWLYEQFSDVVKDETCCCQNNCTTTMKTENNDGASSS